MPHNRPGGSLMGIVGIPKDLMQQLQADPYLPAPGMRPVPGAQLQPGDLVDYASQDLLLGPGDYERVNPFVRFPVAAAENGGGAVAAQQAFIGPAIAMGVWFARFAPAIAALALRLGVSVTRIISWLRRNAWVIARTAGWAAAAVWLADQLNLDQDEGMQIALGIAGEGEKKKRRRYTIGSNPRVRTLQKVARHTMKLLKRHEKYIREFFPKTNRRGELAAREKAHHRLIAKVSD